VSEQGDGAAEVLEPGQPDVRLLAPQQPLQVGHHLPRVVVGALSGPSGPDPVRAVDEDQRDYRHVPAGQKMKARLSKASKLTTPAPPSCCRPSGSSGGGRPSR
jgi:hypothetical protein